MDGAERRVGGVLVRGVDVDEATRCAHWHDAWDVVAFRSPCCEAYHPCSRCHDPLEDHALRPIPASERDEPGVLCGACGTVLTPRAYLTAADACPACGHAWNPGCRAHHPRYFEVPAEP